MASWCLFCQLQCTREGSVFLCVRVVNSNLPLDVLDTTLDLIVPSSGDKPLLLAGLGNQNGGANSSFGLDTWQIGVPRLSMRNKEFDKNSTNLIKKWREWRLDQVSSNHFTPQEDLKLIFSIEDTGIGVPLHSQHRLFQPFSHAGSSASQEQQGTGIGLSICEKLVKLMNGQLTFKSLPGEGSLFQFTLPLSLKAASPNCDTLSCCPKQQWKAVDREKLSGMHVVLIDNHPVRQVKKVHILDLMSVVINW
jgi:histidine kinase 2/3/4 (cytokinin receptor)